MDRRGRGHEVGAAMTRKKDEQVRGLLPKLGLPRIEGGSCLQSIVFDSSLGGGKDSTDT